MAQRLSIDSADSADLIQGVEDLETGRPILDQKKTISHQVKKMTGSKTAHWTQQMKDNYNEYKYKVDNMENAKATYNVSDMAVRASSWDKLRVKEKKARQALGDAEKWLDAAIDASQARLGFMSKYPVASSATGAQGHLEAVKSTLNSAKNAKREINLHRQSKHSESSNHEG
ncbi:hypothetical protein F4778DRAFT_256597 [Xylariomycetidae sp. FL2044]|nr:hypothetical protein F4778DRAFT_256597 [Xylariomycetidae sp. FL2044]